MSNRSISTLDDLVVMLTDALDATFRQSMDGEGRIWWPQFVQTVTIEDDVVHAPFLVDAYGFQRTPLGVPSPRKRVVYNDFRIYLEKFTREIAIPRTKWRVVTSRLFTEITDAGSFAAYDPQRLLIERLNLGDTALVPAPDGLPQFSAGHNLMGATFDNLYSGAPFDLVGLTIAQTALARMPFGVGYTFNGDLSFVVVPPELMVDARSFANSEKVPRQQYNYDNPFQQGFGGYRGFAPYTDGNISDPDKWWAFSSTLDRRPFMHIEHADFPGLETVVLADPASPNVMHNDEIVISGKMTYTVWPGRPETMVELLP